MKSTSIYRELVSSLFGAMNSGDFSGFEAVITDDIAFDFPGTGRAEGARRTLLLLKTLLRKYPGLTFTLSDIVVEGDRACAVWTNEGSSAQGDPYRNSGVTVFHFTGGKISFISDYFKDTSFVEQNSRIR